MKPRASFPAIGLLSNGRYHITLTAAGTGQSRRHGHVVNRWQGDRTIDGDGQFIYLRDLDGGGLWSTAMQPVKCAAAHYSCQPLVGGFRLVAEHEGILSQVDVCVSPTEDFEVRRLTLRNRSDRPRRMEVTSFLEVVANSQDADRGHPAFSKLFVQTSYDEAGAVLFAERRPRSNEEKWPCVFHALAGAPVESLETDRLRFLGRGRSTADPAALEMERLSGTTGSVLDPCFSLRTVVEIAPEGSVELAFITGVGDSPEEIGKSLAPYRTVAALDSLFAAAAKAERALWSELGIDGAAAAKHQALAAAIYYGCGRPAGEVSFDPAASSVWEKFHLPRDRAQVVVDAGWADAVTQECLRARRYWDRKGLYTNLIVLDDGAGSPPEGLDDRVFTLAAVDLGENERAMLFAGAALVIGEELPDLELETAPGVPPLLSRPATAQAKGDDTEDLQFFNGYGGFSSDGSEYVIRLTAGKRPPMPWVNVIANPEGGFLISESGAACTWARNSQANRLTPWSNEPVGDPHSEALYLRDEDSGEVWSPLPGPVAAACDYEVRHGMGYSTFLSRVDGLEQKVTAFVPRQSTVKIVQVRLTNQSVAEKRLSLTAYHQLVLGSLPGTTGAIVTQRAADGSLRAVRPDAGDFRGGIAFAAMSVAGRQAEEITCDRLAFLGRHGTPANPAGMVPGAALDGAADAGLDPCFVQRSTFTIPAGESVTAVVLLGEGMEEGAIAEWISRYGESRNSESALEEAKDYWRTLTGRLRVETPSPMLNVLLNGWMVYQTLSCRIWARTAFYQSSGAYGFRDQLQDAGNLLTLDPSFARRQILLHARHQFEEGDVLHWWHPEPVEKGVRTRFADDLLWLALGVADYIRTTGDAALLDERQPFLKAPVLEKGSDEAFLKPDLSDADGTIYDHCCRAIDRSLAVGAHGLPLMGTGDWNDGMNRVGREGRGESVWMGFFLDHILEKFIPLCRDRGDGARVEKYESHRKSLELALNDGGWDGEWYRRAYYDNGDPLGSRENDECRIDALAQAWAVISKAAPPERANQAMAAMERELISRQDGIIHLLTPPFVKTANDPGYIKGYVAGIRENGGQYTHAACWVVRAVAAHGENALALPLLEMLSPISHSLTPEKADRYMTEPFVIVADVYGVDPHIGRGGWTWYTGSSGWFYRVAIESILGLRIEGGDTLVLKPCVPDEWPSFRMSGHFPGSSTSYHITVENSGRSAKRIASATLDGQPVKVSGSELKVFVPQDGEEHQIRVLQE